MKKKTRTFPSKPRPIVFMPGTITPKDMAQAEVEIPDERLGYEERRIQSRFGCGSIEAVVIAQIMESSVCHGLVSELSDRQFWRDAKEAWKIFQDDREFFLQANAEARALFHKGKREEEAMRSLVTYEI
jgi:hypothetical protein